MNYIKQVAEVLGLEWNEEEGRSEKFDVIRDGEVHYKDAYFEEYGLTKKYGGAAIHKQAMILNGTYTIKKVE